MTQPQQQSQVYKASASKSATACSTHRQTLASSKCKRERELSRTSFSLLHVHQYSCTQRHSLAHTRTHCEWEQASSCALLLRTCCRSHSHSCALCSFGMRAMLIPIRRQSRPAHLHAHSCNTHTDAATQRESLRRIGAWGCLKCYWCALYMTKRCVRCSLIHTHRHAHWRRCRCRCCCYCCSRSSLAVVDVVCRSVNFVSSQRCHPQKLSCRSHSF